MAAYADFSFYEDSYFGDVLTVENANKWLSRASDAVDTLTFGRLTFAFPIVPAHAEKVKKAVCAVAEALYSIDEQRKAAAAQKAEDGSYRGAVTSVSSGRESVSYAAVGAAASVYTQAAQSEPEANRLIGSVAAGYLANVPDANGVNLLYAGEVHHVPRHDHAV